MKGTNRIIMRTTRRLLVGAVLAAVAIASLAPSAVAKGGTVTVRTIKPYGVNDTEAVLDSRVSPHGHEVVIQFQWGRTKRYGHTTWYPEEDPYPYYQHQEIEEVIEGLTPNTVYHYRVMASFEGKKIYGNDVKFKTRRR
jgi:phosphodiesterase/alkaline phosphatase D-like protein